MEVVDGALHVVKAFVCKQRRDSLGQQEGPAEASVESQKWEESPPPEDILGVGWLEGPEGAEWLNNLRVSAQQPASFDIHDENLASNANVDRREAMFKATGGLDQKDPDLFQGHPLGSPCKSRTSSSKITGHTEGPTRMPPRRPPTPVSASPVHAMPVVSSNSFTIRSSSFNGRSSSFNGRSDSFTIRPSSVDRAPSFTSSHGGYVQLGAVQAVPSAVQATPRRPPPLHSPIGGSPSAPPEAIVVSARPTHSSRSVLGEHTAMGEAAVMPRTQSRGPPNRKPMARGGPPDRKPSAWATRSTGSGPVVADINLGARLLHTPHRSPGTEGLDDSMSQPPDEVATPDGTGTPHWQQQQQQQPPQQTPVRSKPSSVFWKPPPEARVVCESVKCLSFNNSSGASHTPVRGDRAQHGHAPVERSSSQPGMHTAPSTHRPRQAAMAQVSSWQPPPLALGENPRPPSLHSFAPSPRYL